MKLDKILNLNKIENKKIRKLVKRVFKKYSFDDCMQIGCVIYAICISANYCRLLGGAVNEKI